MDTNVLAQIFLYEAFLPLIIKGNAKKVLSISSAMGDLDLNREYEFDHATLYSASKAALNMVNIKFGVQYKKDGVLFISMCPGLVDTGGFNDRMFLHSRLVSHEDFADCSYPIVSPKGNAKLQEFVAKLQVYSPTFKGAYEPIESVKHMLSSLDKLSIENGDQGKYLSHLGTKRWIP